MNREKLHLIACQTAFIIVSKNATYVKEMVDNGDVDSLITYQAVQEGIRHSGVAIEKNDTEVVNAILEDVFFVATVKIQIKALIQNIKIYK